MGDKCFLVSADTSSATPNSFICLTYLAPLAEHFAIIKLSGSSLKSLRHETKSKMNILGKSIRHFRKQRKLTQEELTARCNVAGLDLSRSTLAKIEANRRQLTDREIQVFANALGIREGDLFEFIKKQ
ncbi:helix-turn-helix domain-containing protein [Shewanella algae]|uniref:helix-turn-helix domain-containing protein n=1 Tax=Shewanella algae TaxID=38313 RepID=UPI0031F538B8